MADDNLLSSGDGADHLIGGKGRDDLLGGTGKDTLTGGLDRDSMDGGADADVFLYISADESVYGFDGNGTPVYDRIVRFETGLDKLDLQKIDANVVANGDQAFVIVGAFTGTAGELMITDPVGTGDGIESSTLLADLDGDAQADFAIEFFGNVPQGAAAITPFDILL